MGETHFPFDLPGFYDAELQAASDKLQIAIDEAAKIIADHRKIDAIEEDQDEKSEGT